MALYTHLTTAQIASLTAAFGLGPPVKIRGILEGTVNTYYQLCYPGQSFFLKIDEVGDSSRLSKEIRILKALGRHQRRLGFATPFPLPSKTGQDYIKFYNKAVLLFRQIAGKAIHPSALRPRHLYQIGRALSALHLFAGFSNRRLHHRFDLTEMRSVYAEIRERLKKKHPLLNLKILGLLKTLEGQRNASLPGGLIHADLFAENILFNGERLSGLVDFEAAGYGPFLFDLCVALHSLCHLHGRFSLARVNTLIRGYESRRKITAPEKRDFSRMLTETGIRFLLTRLRDFELKNSNVRARPFKDYREFTKRFSEIEGLVKRLDSDAGSYPSKGP